MFVYPGRMLYVGALGTTSLHAHHAHQIALGLEGPLALRTREGREVTGFAAAIPSDMPHAVGTPSRAAALLYIDPDDRFGRRLTRAFHAGGGADWLALAAPLSRWRHPPPTDWGQAMLFMDGVLRVLMPDDAPAKPVHPAVTQALKALERRLGAGEDVRLVTLAREAEISAGRLSHLFALHVGIPLRQYVLWHRMMAAASALQEGRTLTAAAHHAGFTDSAHLTHTFRRMFGVSPSDGLAAIEWVIRPSE